MVVVQDFRGRYTSDGEFHWMFGAEYGEAEDGYDTVEWAAALPGCTGRVGTFGLSYDAVVQWELAALRPPHLVAMAPVGSGSSLLEMTNGIFETGRRLQWCYSMAVSYRQRDGVSTGPRTRDEANEFWHNVERGKWIWWLPLDGLPAEELFHGLADQFREFLRHQNVQFWRLANQPGEIDVPAFQITGWYDRLIGSIDVFNRVRQGGMTERARRNQKLLIGPWGHTTELTRQVGVVDFGAEAELNYYDLLTRWFDYWLKDVENGVMDEPPIKLFVMGENIWRYENEWPLARTVFTDYYFHSGGGANTPRGDGILSPTSPGDEPPDSYVYDPQDPVMSLCLPEMQDAPYHQRPLDHRRDVLVFTSEPLQRDLEVTGPIVVKLWAASTAPETDFTAKLVDVRPDGSAISLCYGILRTCYRDSYENPSPIKPGEVYEYTISLRGTGNLFKKGHRIRVDISSSNFPFFDRNHNTGRPFYEAAELVPANQTVYHDSRYPSNIILPVIPR
jgi:putative CocE/NonD family hydrolase